MLILFNLKLSLLFCYAFALPKFSKEPNEEISSMPDVVVEKLNNELQSKEKLINDVEVELVATPKKVGDIEFDVEVRDDLKESKPPQIVELPESYSNESNERPEVEVESIPEISVGFVVTPKKIGEIEFEVEVQEVLPQEVSIVPEIDSINEDINKSSAAQFDLNKVSKGLKFFQAIDMSDIDSNLNQNDSQVSNTTDTSPTVSITGNSSDVSTGSDTTSTNSNSETTTKRKNKEKYPFWPIILLAILFTLIVFLGVCWAISAYCKSNKEEEAKAEIPVAGSNEVKNESPNTPSSHDIESGQKSAKSLQPESSPSERSMESFNNSIDSLKQKGSQ